MKGASEDNSLRRKAKQETAQRLKRLEEVVRKKRERAAARAAAQHGPRLPPRRLRDREPNSQEEQAAAQVEAARKKAAERARRARQQYHRKAELEKEESFQKRFHKRDERLRRFRRKAALQQANRRLAQHKVRQTNEPKHHQQRPASFTVQVDTVPTVNHFDGEVDSLAAQRRGLRDTLAAATADSQGKDDGHSPPLKTPQARPGPHLRPEPLPNAVEPDKDAELSLDFSNIHADLKTLSSFGDLSIDDSDMSTPPKSSKKSSDTAAKSPRLLFEDGKW